MKLNKVYLAIAVLALLIAVPLTSALSSRDDQLKIERSEKQQLQLKIESVEKQLQNKDADLEQKNKQIESEQQKNKELEEKLQAKLKREEQARLAAERARQAPVVASGGANCDLARQLINQYDWNKDVAYKVMLAESSCNARNENWGDYHSFANCRGSFGLFQINCSHGQVFDPAKNVAIAYSMWKSSGWQPWSATTCKYKVACY